MVSYTHAWLFVPANPMTRTQLLILGSGPAGYTAAVYAARADLQPVLLAGPEPGGQLALTTDVENYPGFPQAIMGPELMDAFRKQAERFGTIVKEVSATKVDLTSQPIKVWAGDEEYQTDCIIIATGASAKWLGLPNEQRLRGKGVSACATCDGFFFRNKEIAVVGGGDSAMEEATYLTKFASKVTVLVRKDSLRASKIMAQRAKTNPKIEFRWNVEVLDVVGAEKVEGLDLKDLKTGETSKLSVQGLFLAIGHQPNTALFADQLETVGPGYLKVIDQVKSSIPGVFIGGDVADWRYRQAVTAAGWGCMAALEAEKYLHEHATD